MRNGLKLITVYLDKDCLDSLDVTKKRYNITASAVVRLSIQLAARVARGDAVITDHPKP